MELTIKVPFVDEVSMHVKRHKTKYIVGTTALVTYLVTKNMGSNTITVAPVFNNTFPLIKE